MALIDQLSGYPEPCAASDGCFNSPDHLGNNGPPVCGDCKFALRLGGLSNRWDPLRKGDKHPLVVEARRLAKIDADLAKREKKRGRDKGKMEVQRLAQRAEKRTDQNIIAATKNSGRTNKDADHVMAGRITLDTKNQARLHPIVHVNELEKVRSDARRAGNPIGGLVLRNENGHGFVVLAEEDFALLVKALQ